MSFSLQEIAEVNRARARWIASIVVLTGVVAVIVSLVLTPEFRSTTTLYRSNDRKAMGGSGLKDITGLASMFGYDLSAGQATFHIPDLVGSRVLQRSLIERRWTTQRFATPVTLVEFWELEKPSWSPVAVIRRLFSGDSVSPRAIMEEALDRFDSQVKVSEEESGLYRISVWMEEPQLAADLANAIATEVQTYVMKRTGEKSTAFRAFLEGRLSDAKQQLSDTEDGLTEFRRRHPVALDTPELQLQRARLMRSVEVNQQVYITLRQQFELARLDELKEKPVIEILDTAEPPSKKDRPVRSLIVLGSMAMAYLAALYGAFILERRKRPA